MNKGLAGLERHEGVRNFIFVWTIPLKVLHGTTDANEEPLFVILLMVTERSVWLVLACIADVLVSLSPDVVTVKVRTAD